MRLLIHVYLYTVVECSKLPIESFSLWDLLYVTHDGWNIAVRNDIDRDLISTWESNLVNIQELLRTIVADDEAFGRGQPTQLLGSIAIDSSYSESPVPGLKYTLHRDFEKRFSNRIFRGVCNRAVCHHKELIFKYQTNCPELYANRKCSLKSATGVCEVLQDEDPLVKEFVISRILTRVRISPLAFTLSPPVPLRIPKLSRGGKLAKLNFNLLKSKEWRTRCLSGHFHVDPTVRLIVEDYAGTDLHDFYQKHILSRNQSLGIHEMIESIRLFGRIIETLQVFHDNGFVHGDIHSGNIAVRRAREGMDFEVSLLDFGLAKFFPAELGAHKRFSTNVYTSFNVALLSPFQLSGSYRTGRRDDVFRAFEILVNFLTKYNYSKFFAGYSKIDQLIYYGHQFFDNGYRGIRSTVLKQMLLLNSGGGKQDAIKDFDQFCEIMKQMLLYLRGETRRPPHALAHPDDRPDYPWIIDHAYQLIDILNPYLLGTSRKPPQ